MLCNKQPQVQFTQNHLEFTGVLGFDCQAALVCLLALFQLLILRGHHRSQDT